MQFSLLLFTISFNLKFIEKYIAICCKDLIQFIFCFHKMKFKETENKK